MIELHLRFKDQRSADGNGNIGITRILHSSSGKESSTRETYSFAQDELEARDVVKQIIAASEAKIPSLGKSRRFLHGDENLIDQLSPAYFDGINHADFDNLGNLVYFTTYERNN